MNSVCVCVCVCVTFAPHCLHHNNNTNTETLSHILNGCFVYKGMYIARHDRIVDIAVKGILSYLHSSVKVVKHSRVLSSMFHLCNQEQNVFQDITANTPDAVFVDEDCREVNIIEVGCTFDHSLEEAFLTKVLKYQQLKNAISQTGYQCKLIVLIFGSLGTVHKLVVRGLQMAGMPKPKAKALAKFCSVSAIIGSRHIWRRRCFLYP